MNNKIKVNTQSSIKIGSIYFDPYLIDDDMNDASYIFITHSHYDHFSIPDILKVKNDNTKIVIPNDLHLLEKVKDIFDDSYIIIVEVGNNYDFNDISFSTVPAYNLDKQFHLAEYGWVGYLLSLENTIYYIAGDTDLLPENLDIHCDVCFVPIGGFYTMAYEEAASFVNQIHPKVVIPTHYGSIVGKIEYGEKFSKLLDSDIECQLYIK